MSEFVKTAIYFDSENYESQLSNYEGRAEYMQEVVTNLKNIVPEITFDSNDLTPLFTNAKSFLVDKIVKEPMTIGGVDLDKNKVFDLLESANALNKVTERINYLNSNKSVTINERGVYAHVKNFIIDENDTVVVLDSFKEDLKRQNTVFVSNERQKNIYECAKTIVQSYEEFQNKVSAGIPFVKFIEDYFIPSSTGKVEINYKEIVR